MQYPSNLGGDDGGGQQQEEDESATSSIMVDQRQSAGELDRIWESSADQSGSSSTSSSVGGKPLTMDLASSSFQSAHSEEAPAIRGESERDIEARLLYAGNLTNLDGQDGDDDQSNHFPSTPSPLHSVLAALSLSADRLLESEGVQTLEDLHLIEDCIRDDRVSLKSVEKIRLLHYLDWRKQYPHLSPNDFCDSYRDFVRDEPLPAAVWPFGRHITGSVLLYPLKFVAQDELYGEEREQFGLADLDLELYESEAGTMADLHRGLERLRLIANGSHNETILRAFACVKLGVLYHSMQDSSNAMRYLQRAAVEFQVPTACLYYGHALITGESDVAKDIAAGLLFLNQAATAGLGEAYYVIAQHYEDVHNFEKATQFYRRADHFFVRSDVPGWRGMITGMSALTRSFRRKERYSISEPLIRGYTLNPGSTEMRSNIVDARCCVLLFQFVLLIVMALLSNQPVAYHFPVLLIGVPILGLLAALYSLVETSRLSRIMEVERQSMRELQRSKLMAFRSLLKVPYDIPRISFLYKIALAYYEFLHWIQSSTEPSTNDNEDYIKELEDKLIWIEASGYTIASSSDGIASAFTFRLIELLLVGLWVVSLVQEASAYGESCSNWWESTCPLESG